MTADIKSWSEGCQVINGTVYLDPGNHLVNCGAFAAVNNGEVNSTPTRTRGAYNVLLDLVTALGSDLAPTVKYTLLLEDDLSPSSSLGAGLAAARASVVALLA